VLLLLFGISVGFWILGCGEGCLRTAGETRRAPVAGCGHRSLARQAFGLKRTLGGPTTQRNSLWRESESSRRRGTAAVLAGGPPHTARDGQLIAAACWSRLAERTGRASYVERESSRSEAKIDRASISTAVTADGQKARRYAGRLWKAVWEVITGTPGPSLIILAQRTKTMLMKPTLALWAPLFLCLDPPGRGACAFVTVSRSNIDASRGEASLTRTAAAGSVKVSYSNSDDNADGESKSIAATPSFIQTPLLVLLYPSLVSHKKEFGNPNIPLGSPDGKRCATVRRLHFQGKLSDEEVDHLQEMGFRFNSFEDVYYENDFEEMLGTLMHYFKKTKTFQIPKKYELDPELGAPSFRTSPVFFLCTLTSSYVL